jgi:hypothetical protein
MQLAAFGCINAYSSHAPRHFGTKESHVKSLELNASMVVMILGLAIRKIEDKY